MGRSPDCGGKERQVIHATGWHSQATIYGLFLVAYIFLQENLLTSDVVKNIFKGMKIKYKLKYLVEIIIKHKVSSFCWITYETY